MKRIKIIIVIYNSAQTLVIYYTVAYLGFNSGGVQNFSGKLGVFEWHEAPCSEATLLLGGFGGMLPRENFLKWCNLVRFRENFAKILSKKSFKNSHF